ncbi:MAG: STAS domain-containing protein [Anaerolineales bacterium]|nr:STAS domain-containing protein [Anaerolineales bacterium]MBX3038334.1 STAS domain-containing protein [Anaerolineales bacterium]
MDSFSVSQSASGGVAVVVISGRVDSLSAVTLESELTKVMKNHKKIVLDMKNVEYVSSAGVRTIMKVLQSTQKSGGGLKLASLSNTVKEVLENVGMTQFVKTFSSIDEAVASF